MTYICEVCNGLESLSSSCPTCLQPADDQGKLSDFYGPYSPYRPIDDLKATNGFDDARQHLCIHLAYCPNCSASFPVSVHEHAGME
ncbi:hypothetical protein ACFQI7_10660 [Paenibacillus allorhizosphaerae]|uniref:C2H2-type domain-containing protein n=1 Tax=Paenibacillus allorhizosphaerae TaxID=2849866 RepID=A0ABN7TPK0_9BACL|nr:hypothetical protein [Paenibacillus allorhizosphaerae]CAG7643101.1 hypothetical protein PAECIP111802_02953 [Paenibacillus allorhizosphaerae]